MDIIPLMKDEFINYASPVLINNLPSIDGLLPVQRKVIWALYKNKIFNNKSFIKLLRAGSMSMVYYIYGDLPLYKAMKNMANNGLNYFYLTPKGSFGDKRKRDGVGASPRYIECKLSEYSEDMLSQIDKNIVPMKRNFDDTENEPIILSSIIPNILVNISQSIAVGEASKIPPHNLIDTCNAIINYIKTKDIDSSIDILKCPDFIGFGGKIIHDKYAAYKIYKTGKGNFNLIGSYITKDEKNDIKFTITEVPYGSYIEDIEDKIRNSYDKGLFREIIDIHDSTDRKGIKLDIYLRKHTDINLFEAKLMKYTPYQTVFSCNFTILDLNGKVPILMNLQNIFDKWIQHRISCIKKSLEFDINKNNIELNKLNGLAILTEDKYSLDTAINLIRCSETKLEAIEYLRKQFNLNQKQLNYIVTISLINMNKEWIATKIDNINTLNNENIELNNILYNDNKIKAIIIEQLQNISKKYGIPRKTEIIYKNKIEDILDENNLIENYNCKLVLTKDNYFKKVPLTSLRGNSTNKLKNNDFIIRELNSTNKSTVLLFSSLGICYKVYLHEIEDSKLSNLGQYLPTLLHLDKNEYIITMLSVEDSQYIGDIIEIFENGKIAKIPLESFKTETKRTKLKNSLYLNNGQLINLFVINKNIDILLQTNINKILITDTSIINSKKSKNTSGIQIMRMKNNSKIIFGEQLNNINLNNICNIDYYKNTSGKGTGNFLKKEDSIETL